MVLVIVLHGIALILAIVGLVLSLISWHMQDSLRERIDKFPIKEEKTSDDEQTEEPYPMIQYDERISSLTYFGIKQPKDMDEVKKHIPAKALESFYYALIKRNSADNKATASHIFEKLMLVEIYRLLTEQSNDEIGGSKCESDKGDDNGKDA